MIVVRARHPGLWTSVGAGAGTAVGTALGILLAVLSARPPKRSC